MRIVFIGAVQFSASMLNVLLSKKANVVGVCTLLNAPSNADHVDLSYLARKAGLPVLDAQNINSVETVEWIRQLVPDVIFCLGWSRLIGKELLSIAPLGVIGYHPAALPANRGRHPLIWSLALGLEKTASTFFFMNERADAGDIISQVSVPISRSDDASDLYSKLTKVAELQLRNILSTLEVGTFNRFPQDESLANVWRKRRRIDGQIDWRMSAISIHNLIRALAKPYVGAHFLYEGVEYKVWGSEIIPDLRRNLEPGKVLAIQTNGIIVKAGVDAIQILMTKPISNLQVGDYL